MSPLALARTPGLRRLADDPADWVHVQSKGTSVADGARITCHAEFECMAQRVRAWPAPTVPRAVDFHAARRHLVVEPLGAGKREFAA